MIRKATFDDLEQIVIIYDHGRALMRQMQSPQWQNGYPSLLTTQHDIEKGALYVYEFNDQIIGVMAVFDYESTYKHINGAWLSDKPYKVMHRIATHKEYYHKGISQHMIEYVFHHLNSTSIRIDTHRLNIPMQNLLKKIGFTYCGIILLNQNEDRERLAYQKDI